MSYLVPSWFDALRTSKHNILMVLKSLEVYNISYLGFNGKIMAANNLKDSKKKKDVELIL